MRIKSRSKASLLTRLWFGRVASALLIALVLSFVILFTTRARERERAVLAESMDAILKTTEGGFRLWKLDRLADIASLAEIPDVRRIVTQGLQESSAYRSKDSLAKLRDYFTPFVRNHGYLGFAVFIRDRSGRVRPLFEENPVKREFYLRFDGVIPGAIDGKPGMGQPFVVRREDLPAEVFPSNPKQAIMIVATPIMSESGHPIAALAFYFDPVPTLSEITRLARMGQTGETYVVGRLGHMITSGRFEDQLRAIGLISSRASEPSLFAIRDPGGNLLEGFRPTTSRSAMPLTQMAESLSHGGAGVNLDGYRDYRGVPVVGAWKWLPELGLGIATEVDRVEAYAAAASLNRLFWTVMAAIFLIMTALFILQQARFRLAQANVSMQTLTEARKELLASIAHDLKNPLSALLLNNELLIKTLPQNHEFTERRRLLLERSREAADRMRGLIGDLLDSAKIDAGKMSIHVAPCRIDQSVQSVLRLFDPIAAQKGVKIELEAPTNLPELEADEGRLFQIFSNLLGNAVKFSPDGGSVRLRIAKDGPQLVCSVSDDGPGIPKEELPHLFERYWQSGRAKRMGTGLGLAITRELVNQHGGRIWVESKVNQGSTFLFSLPLHSSKDNPRTARKL